MPGILLGVGLGGFVDGMMLHQILQWHHTLTSALFVFAGGALPRSEGRAEV